MKLIKLIEFHARIKKIKKTNNYSMPEYRKSWISENSMLEQKTNHENSYNSTPESQKSRKLNYSTTESRKLWNS